MIYALVGGLVVTAGLLVWLSASLGVVGLVVALCLALGGLIYIAVSFWKSAAEEHLYSTLPRVESIRKPLTPANYTVRSNLDPPFFSFESQNYGDKRPRTRIKNVPIDRYIELQERIDQLSKAIAKLTEQLANAKAAVTITEADGEVSESPTLLIREPVAPAAPTDSGFRPASRPLVDSTLRVSRIPKRKEKSLGLSDTEPRNATAPTEKRKGPRAPNTFLEILANRSPRFPRIWNHK